MKAKHTSALHFFLIYLRILLPVLLVSFIVAQNTINKLKEKEFHAVSLQLDHIANELKNMYVTYYENSVTLSSSLELMPHRILANYSNGRAGIELLKKVKLLNTNFSDIFMYYGTDDVYSSMGKANTRIYFNKILSLNGDSAANGLELLESPQEGALCLFKNGKDGYFFLHYPVRLKTGDYNVSVNYCFSLSYLSDVIGRLQDTASSYIKIVFSDGGTLYFGGDTKGSIVTVEQNKAEEMLSSDKYTAVAKEVHLLGMELTFFYRSDLLYNDVKTEQILNYFILIGGMLLSSGAAIIFSKKREKSIRRLEAIFSGNEPPSASKARGSEYDYIQSMIQRSLTDSRFLKKDMAVYRSAMRQQTSLLIFHGLIQDSETIARLYEACGLVRCEEYFYVGGVMLSGEEKKETVKQFKRLLENDLYYETTLLGQTVILFLAELPSFDYTITLREKMARRLTAVLEDSGIHPRYFAASQVYQSHSMANYAYMEAMSILEQMHRNRVSYGRLECWENIIKNKPAGGVLYLNQEELEAFGRAVREYDEAGASENLHKLHQRIQLNPCSEENKRYLRYCILQPLMVAVQSQPDSPSDELLSEIVNIDPSDGENFEKAVKRLLLCYCSRKPHDEFSNILGYIADNYSKSELTAEEVANFSGFTKTYLSKLFKAKIGMSYIDYLTGIRLEKACQLLRETDLPIHAIVAKVGYLDASSFRRKFKSVYGLGVSEYRLKWNP